MKYEYLQNKKIDNVYHLGIWMIYYVYILINNEWTNSISCRMTIIFKHRKETLHLNQWLNIFIIFYFTEYLMNLYDYEMVEYEYHIYHAMIKPLCISQSSSLPFGFVSINLHTSSKVFILHSKTQEILA